jgi:Tol biopolymer transport system component
MPEIRCGVLLLATVVSLAILAASGVSSSATLRQRGGSRLIAFSLGRAKPGCTSTIEGACDTTAIWTVKSDGSRLHQLTTFAGNSSPAWSPDGRRIAYDSGREIYVMNADGTQNRRLTRTAGSRSNYSGDPRWSPDGKKIVYVYSPISDGDRIRIMDADGSHVHTLRFRADDDNEFLPDWAPDGSRIAFVSDKPLGNGLTRLTVYTVNTDGTGLRKIMNPSEIHSIRWSPDGRKLLVLTRFPSVVNADGSRLHSFRPSKYVNSVSWSPDGQQIVYAASAEPMRILRLKDGSVRTVQVRAKGVVNSVDWQRLAHAR